MKVFYGKGVMRVKAKNGDMLEREYGAPNYEWHLQGYPEVRFSLADFCHATGETRHYVKGIIEGARGMNGFDSKIRAKLEEIRALVYNRLDDDAAQEVVAILKKGRV
jgi:hypothetical protein